MLIRVAAQIDPQWLTLVHGDTHQGNFMLPKDVDKDQVVLIDWHRYGIDIGRSPSEFFGAIMLFRIILSGRTETRHCRVRQYGGESSGITDSYLPRHRPGKPS